MAVKAKALHFQVDVTISWAAGGWIAHILEANPNGLTDEDGDPLFEFMEGRRLRYKDLIANG